MEIGLSDIPAGVYFCVLQTSGGIQTRKMIKIKEIKPRYIIDENGKKKSVILPVAEYNELMEDIEDLAKVAERREEYTISHEDLVNQLKEDGLL